MNDANSMVRFKNAPGFEFTSNPQVRYQPAIVYFEGFSAGKVIPNYSRSRGLRFRVYDRAGLCHADCGQLGNAFDVLRSIVKES